MLFSTLAVHGATSDDMQIYSGRFVNGWGDGWSWMTHYPTNNPVYTSNSVFVTSNSVARVPSAPYVVWWLNSGITVDATLYTNLTFWLNGGATGGQNISVNGELNGSFGTSFSFRVGSDELMEASYHFSRRDGRQQDQPDRFSI